jgi:hypothetical protein
MHTLYSSRQVELEAGKVGVRKIVAKSDSSVFVAAVEDLLHAPPPETSVASGRPDAPHALSPINRTEDTIRELCAQLFATKDDQTNAQILVGLREALHRHIEHLRARVAEYPAVLGRRTQDTILPHDTLTLENAAKDLASSNSTDPRIAATPEPPRPGSTIKVPA